MQYNWKCLVAWFASLTVCLLPYCMSNKNNKTSFYWRVAVNKNIHRRKAKLKLGVYSSILELNNFTLFYISLSLSPTTHSIKGNKVNNKYTNILSFAVLSFILLYRIFALKKARTYKSTEIAATITTAIKCLERQTNICGNWNVLN